MVWAQLRSLLRDVRQSAARPPAHDAPADVQIGYLCVCLLSAMLTWRFLAVFSGIVALAWWMGR